MSIVNATYAGWHIDGDERYPLVFPCLVDMEERCVTEFQPGIEASNEMIEHHKNSEWFEFVIFEDGEEIPAAEWDEYTDAIDYGCDDKEWERVCYCIKYSPQDLWKARDLFYNPQLF